MNQEENSIDFDQNKLCDQIIERYESLQKNNLFEDDEDLENISNEIFSGTDKSHAKFMAFLAYVAKWSYWNNKTDMERKWKGWSPHNIYSLPTDIRVFTLINDQKQLIICFRGTVALSPVNWILDASCVRYKFPPVTNNLVHQGFKIGYWSIRKELRNYIKKLVANNSIDSVCICGHSLGGAMATLCALDLKNNPIPKLKKEFKLVTFGQPAVGGQGVANEFDRIVPKSHYYRYHNIGDIVPRYPMLWYYKHGGTHIKIRYDKKNAVNTLDEIALYEKLCSLKEEELKGYLNMDDNKFMNELDLPPFWGHGINNYWKVLQKMARDSQLESK